MKKFFCHLAALLLAVCCVSCASAPVEDSRAMDVIQSSRQIQLMRNIESLRVVRSSPDGSYKVDKTIADNWRMRMTVEQLSEDGVPARSTYILNGGSLWMIDVNGNVFPCEDLFQIMSMQIAWKLALKLPELFDEFPPLRLSDGPDGEARIFLHCSPVLPGRKAVDGYPVSAVYSFDANGDNVKVVPVQPEGKSVQEVEAALAEASLRCWEEYTDFQEYRGFRIAGTAAIVEGEKREPLILRTVEVNPSVDDSFFLPPQAPDVQ